MTTKVAGVFMALSLLASGSAFSQAGESASATDIAVSWAVVDNFREGGFSFLLTFYNVGTTAMPADGWELYFNFIRRIHADQAPPSVAITHINGDFYRLEPRAGFPALAPGEWVTLPMRARAWAIKEFDAPRGLYFVSTNGGPAPRIAGEVSVAPFVHDAQQHRSLADRLPVPGPVQAFAHNESLSILPAAQLSPITPTPRSLIPHDGTWTLGPRTAIAFEEGLENEADFLAEALEPVAGRRLATGRPAPGGADVIRLRKAELASNDAYSLRISPSQGVEISGSPAGVFYGIQSLRMLVPQSASSGGGLVLPALLVEDVPLFDYRGMHLDISRNFQPLESIRMLIDGMALYKLNNFHFHLTDDEGWRLEIAGLPELTRVGGRRGHTLDEREHLIPSYGSGPEPDHLHGSGYLTREDYIELLRYANRRHIRVIPEIDMPGHARAAIIAMEARYLNLTEAGARNADEHRLHDPEDASTYRSVQNWDDNVVNVCLESTYRFLEAVIDDLVAMHREAGAPLDKVHIGGDEVPLGVWQGSPVCQALIAERDELNDARDLFDYFLRRMDDILDSRGLTLAGWEEIGLTNPFYTAGRKEPNPEFAPRGFVAFVWNAVWGWGAEDLGYRMANAGYPVVLSNASNLYFDLAYDKHPEEPGLYWAGFASTRTTWEFAPFDLFLTARHDMQGVPLDPFGFADRARLTDSGRANVLGIQGQLWSEMLSVPGRMEFMAFPRLIALAERAWASEPDWKNAADLSDLRRRLDVQWNEFANRIGQLELPRLDQFHGGVGYRIPPPGAIVRDGMLHANVAYPGLTIRYTLDGSVPTEDAPRYERPVRAGEHPVSLRTFDTRGRGSRVVTVEP
jgi:hexosaminidase